MQKFTFCDIFYYGDYMRILIVRHGDPDYKNDSLTEKGFYEAELLKERLVKLDVKDFYCSPLGRAQATAKPTLDALGRDAKTLDWLREFPAFILDPVDGHKRIPWDLMPDFWTNKRDLYDKDDWIKNPVMTSGNVEKLYTDVCQSLDELIASYGYERKGNCYKVLKENTDTIVLFCHFGIECVLLSHILGISPLVLWQGFIALPTAVTTLFSEEREKGTAYFRVTGFGDVSHLYSAGQEPSFAGRFCETFSNTEERH